jgi:hypothetical protein
MLKGVFKKGAQNLFWKIIIDEHLFQRLGRRGKNSYVKRGFLWGAHKISFETKIIDEQFFQTLNKGGKKFLCQKGGF